MSKMINTLLGQVKSEDLGTIYVHEHILTDPPLARMYVSPDYKIADADKITQEVMFFHEAGGNTIVDCTALDYGRNAAAMREVAKRVPVNILCVTGFNRGDYAEWVVRHTKEEFIDMMLKDIQEGMDGTDAKAALIKIGTNYNFIIPIEQTIMEAAGHVHKKTNVPVITHTHLGTMGLQQVKILSENGVDPNNIALSHMDHNLDFYYLSRIMKTGAYVLFDSIGKVKYGTDEDRINMIKRLCDAGLEDRMLISGDMGRESYLKAFGGGPGFEFILKEFIPRLREEGFTEELINKFFRINPNRFLSGEK